MKQKQSVDRKKFGESEARRKTEIETACQDGREEFYLLLSGVNM